MFFPLLIVILFSSLIPTRQIYADSRVNIESNTFYDALEPYGSWVNHPLYGQVWYPDNVAQDWRPYTDGYWAYTDDYGWLWVSYEPWGWAPFHYGRWAWDNWYGWIWVPGRTWAPAWVFWRSGGGYAAWAPMPPNVMWQSGVGLNISYFNYHRDLRWDSWVAVREHDLPDRHISRHISPRSQNRQVIDVTNQTNNVTLINNTIVNQGVPVKQIEAVTRRRVEAVVPKIHDRADINIHEQREGQPDIVRLPMTAPTHQEIQHNEELARRLDGKNTDGTRTELPVPDLGKSGNHEPRLPGRLQGAPASVKSPYTTPEQVSPVLTEAIGQVLPKPVIPELPMLSINPDTPHKEPTFGRKQEPLLPVQGFDQQSSSVMPLIAPTSSPVDETGAPVVLSNPTSMPPVQNELQPSELSKQSGNQSLQGSVANQQQTESQQSEYLQRQQKIGRLQEELVGSQDKLKQQQADHAVEPVQQMQTPEAVRQPEMQNQQQVDVQSQQAERARLEVQQLQQQELQNQQQVEAQSQQVERARVEAQQVQQQESARQQELQNQQQVEAQSQQAERARVEAQQLQQQEAARQQELQNQQQVEAQSQQAERARVEAQKTKEQEVARQREIDSQQTTIPQ
jgi:hypothetical protein